MSTAEIKRMSRHERLAAMEQLWDAICHDAQEPDSPSWHKAVLEARKLKMSSADARYVTLEELRKRFT